MARFYGSTPDIKESDVENWIAENPSEVWKDYTGYLDEKSVRPVVTIGRQVVLPSGRRIDLLLMTEWYVVVVEVKRDLVDMAAVTQLLDYIDELKRCVPWTLMGLLVGCDVEDAAYQVINHMHHVSFTPYETHFSAHGEWISNPLPTMGLGNRYRDDVKEPFGSLIREGLRDIERMRRRHALVRLQDAPQSHAVHEPRLRLVS